ncbi:hypothetical protein [Gallaecimonas mangrovi]|uniref:hypothetical protein n=1 Tax=Gallaecimonas mangrovi TaxID=2291597 RepID=UPI000E20C642|nr:hypothetical protein [Gallaecimonas mangrovi]
MGLAQNIRLEDKVSCDQASLFLDNLCTGLQFKKSDNKWIVHSMHGEQMSFEIVVIDEGFYTHRSGDYFLFLGFFIEQLTGEFGCISIEDV